MISKTIKVEDLSINVKTEGNITHSRPVFSKNGSSIFVAWKNIIREFNTETGEFVKDFEENDGIIISIMADPTDYNNIYGMSSLGHLLVWDVNTGLRKDSLRLKMLEQEEVLNFLIINEPKKSESKHFIFVIQMISKKNHSYLHKYEKESGKHVQKFDIPISVLPHNSAAGGQPGSHFIASIFFSSLSILNVASDEIKTYKIQFQQKLECVACHPSENCVATGDDTGRITLWWNVLDDSSVATSVYHWHTLPVKDIAFSSSGSNFYSCGFEGVIVKWNPNSPNQRAFIPRLGCSVKHLSVCPDTLYISASTTENSILIVTPDMYICRTIQYFNWRIKTENEYIKADYPAGIKFDPRSKCLVVNGKVGHLNFFSPSSNSSIFNLDVTNRNHIPQDRSKQIINFEVTKFAISENGRWLATVEERNDRNSILEVELKFWRYEDIIHNYSLISSFDFPHYGLIYALEFQPLFGDCDDDDVKAVTTGEDGNFRVWRLVDSSFNKKRWWQCENANCYQNLKPRAAGFSEDGSLLGVAFEEVLTVWDSESYEMKVSLSHTFFQQPIRFVEFGRKDSCYLVVTASNENVAVWNLLSCSILWVVPLNVKLLIADPSSEFMAVISKRNKLHVFIPKDRTPVIKGKNLIKKYWEIAVATFAPGKTSGLNKLYFISSDKKLFVVEQNLAEEITKLQEPKEQKNIFASMIAPQISSDVQTLKSIHHKQLGHPANKLLTQFWTIPCHTMPSMKLFCKPILESYLIKNEKESNEEEVEKKTKGRNILWQKNKADIDKEEHLRSLGNILEIKDENHQITSTVNPSLEESLLKLLKNYFFQSGADIFQ